MLTKFSLFHDHSFQIHIIYLFLISQRYLTEKDLETYMFDQIPTLPRIASLHKSFYPYYATLAARKFLFFLDPKNTGKIRIPDLVLSPLMAELEEARAVPAGEGEGGGEEGKGNWFSARTALRVYGQVYF